jgi:hypothetical protein
MKRFLFCISILEAITIIFLIGFLSMYRNPGFYEPNFNYIYCTNKKACLHEVGHKLDHHLGNISTSQEYQHSIDVYRAIVWAYPQYRDQYALYIYQYPGLGSILWQSSNPAESSFWNGGWGGYSEFYADVVMYSDGKPENCSVFLRDYYDWSFIQSEMAKLGYPINQSPETCNCIK